MELKTVAEEIEKTAWSWLKKTSPKLFQVDKAPLLGNAPEFPWQALSQELAVLFQKEGLLIEPETLEWKPFDDIIKKIQAPHVQAICHASGFEGTVSFLMQESDFKVLMANILGTSLEEVEDQDSIFIESFDRFLTAACVQTINDLTFVKDITFSLSSEKTIPQELPVLCQDFWITIPSGEEKSIKLFAAIIIDPAFHTAWHAHFVEQIPQKEERLENISVRVHLEAGRSHLSYDELKACKAGDCILLDEVFFFPESEHKQLVLAVNDVPFCRTQLKDGGLEVIERPS